MIWLVLLVIAIFALLVFVHELGHFVMARRGGVEVDEFGFGFPPRLFGRKVGRTLYSINLLPLGGFVRLRGEDLADRSAHSFGAASFATKVKILLAGVGMNLAVAYVILVALCVVGLPPVLDNQFSLGNPTYAQPRQLLAVDVAGGSPAETAGIHRGDIILTADGRRLVEEQELIDFTRENAGREVILSVKRGDQIREVKAKLRDPGATDGFLGVTPLQTYKLSYGWLSPLVAAGLLAQIIWATLVGILQFFIGIPLLVVSLFTKEQVTGTASGPVGIVMIVKNVLHLGASYLWLLIATISVSLAVFNVLPIPAVDGGRLALAAVQRFSGRNLAPTLEALIHGVGFISLLLLMLLVTVFDLRRL